ncbi:MULTISPECIES: hypothetical protein [unclassified Paenibacillus]|uniref:hypothetical protein n=1 Tax=unclassified Paenibacillus TaxID=185978 RepID=UPI0015E3C58C|nr:MULTISPECIES: hypothetical protein [unclassified Paenibacillus]QZN79020.1 hypothetical protein K5K90_16510 [Paenibacillus sp. DR312]
MAIFEFLVIILLLAIVVLLFRINSKLPERDWVKEAMERDRNQKHNQDAPN